MPSAKASFLERIGSLHKSIMIEAVRAKELTEYEHNEIAKMLRNGLAVVGFATLEDFIKKRTSEIMDSIGTLPIPFNSLPEKIQKATTYEAIKALSQQLKNHDDHLSKLTYIQTHAMKIASTSTSNFELTPHAFGYDQSNVSKDTVKTILNSFYVNDPWAQMTRLSSRLSLTSLSLETSFANASARRHKAAHEAGADTPQMDIMQYVKEALGIAVGFDCLISHAYSLLQRQDQNYLNGTTPIIDSQIHFRTIKYVNNTWKEYNGNSNKAYRTSTDLATFLPSVRSRAQGSKQVLVQYDQNNMIINWET